MQGKEKPREIGASRDGVSDRLEDVPPRLVQQSAEAVSGKDDMHTLSVHHAPQFAQRVDAIRIPAAHLAAAVVDGQVVDSNLVIVDAHGVSFPSWLSTDTMIAEQSRIAIESIKSTQ